MILRLWFGSRVQHWWCALWRCAWGHLPVDVWGLVFPPGMPNVEVGSFLHVERHPKNLISTQSIPSCSTEIPNTLRTLPRHWMGRWMRCLKVMGWEASPWRTVDSVDIRHRSEGFYLNFIWKWGTPQFIQLDGWSLFSPGCTHHMDRIIWRRWICRWF